MHEDGNGGRSRDTLGTGGCGREIMTPGVRRAELELSANSFPQSHDEFSRYRAFCKGTFYPGWSP